MKSESHRSMKEGQPEQRGKISGSKRRMIERTKVWKPETSPKLREIYSTKIEWLQKVIPKLLTKEAEA
jgi:hypothetical protein